MEWIQSALASKESWHASVEWVEVLDLAGILEAFSVVNPLGGTPFDETGCWI